MVKYKSIKQNENIKKLTKTKTKKYEYFIKNKTLKKNIKQQKITRKNKKGGDAPPPLKKDFELHNIYNPQNSILHSTKNNTELDNFRKFTKEHDYNEKKCEYKNNCIICEQYESNFKIKNFIFDGFNMKKMSQKPISSGSMGKIYIYESKPYKWAKISEELIETLGLRGIKSNIKNIKSHAIINNCDITYDVSFDTQNINIDNRTMKDNVLILKPTDYYKLAFDDTDNEKIFAKNDEYFILKKKKLVIKYFYVYEEKQMETNKNVTLKTSNVNEGSEAAFMEEKAIISVLNDDIKVKDENINVVPSYIFSNTNNNCHIIAMDNMDGDLDSYLKHLHLNSKLTEFEKMQKKEQIFKSTLDIIIKLLKHDCYYYDLKLGNVLYKKNHCQNDITIYLGDLGGIIFGYEKVDELRKKDANNEPNSFIEILNELKQKNSQDKILNSQVLNATFKTINTIHPKGIQNGYVYMLGKPTELFLHQIIMFAIILFGNSSYTIKNPNDNKSYKYFTDLIYNTYSEEMIVKNQNTLNNIENFYTFPKNNSLTELFNSEVYEKYFHGIDNKTYSYEEIYRNMKDIVNEKLKNEQDDLNKKTKKYIIYKNELIKHVTTLRDNLIKISTHDPNININSYDSNNNDKSNEKTSSSDIIKTETFDL